MVDRFGGGDLALRAGEEVRFGGGERVRVDSGVVS